MGKCRECGHPVEVQVEDRATLWDEYKHRHNLAWKVIFQVTAAVVVLSIVPYIAPDPIKDSLGRWLLAAPALALALVLFSLFVMVNELSLLRLITKAHRDQQRRVFQIRHDERQHGERKGTFDTLVWLYLIILLVLGAGNLIVSAGHLPSYWPPSWLSGWLLVWLLV